MRDAPDVVFVVAAYLSAYNARAFGVQDYIAQMMFNSPPGLSDAMDLAKMLACLALIEPLTDGTAFRVYRQTRSVYSATRSIRSRRGHLAASTYLQMALKPHIVHVVGHTEAHHTATADDVIAACKVARRAIKRSGWSPDVERPTRPTGRATNWPPKRRSRWTPYVTGRPGVADPSRTRPRWRAP